MRFKNLQAAALLFLCCFVISANAIDILRPVIEPRYAGAQPNEWTMDYDAALAYAASNGLHTIVMFTGSWWCPYCQSLEEKVLTNPDWQNYLSSEPAMLVMLDFNLRPATGLPPDHPYNKCFLWDPDYLASNGLSEAEGNARLAVNYQLQDEYSLPSTLAEYGYLRVSYPTWVILRPDGTRRARMVVSDFRDDSVTPAMAVSTTIRRYEQALLSDPADEMDDEALMNPVPLSIPAAPVEGTLSENDNADNYSFASDPKSMLDFVIDALPGVPAVPVVVSVLKSDGLTLLHEEVITPAPGAVISYRVPFDGSFFLKIATETVPTNVVGYTLSVTRSPFNEENNRTRIYKYRANLKATKPVLQEIAGACEPDYELCYRDTTRRSLRGFLYFCGNCSQQPNMLIYFYGSDTAYHLLGGVNSEYLFLNFIGFKSNKLEGVLAISEPSTGLELLHGGFGTGKDGVLTRIFGNAAGTISPAECRNALCEDVISMVYDCNGDEMFDVPDALNGNWSLRYSAGASRQADEISALLYIKEKLPKSIEYIVEDGAVIPRDEWLTGR